MNRFGQLLDGVGEVLLGGRQIAHIHGIAQNCA